MPKAKPQGGIMKELSPLELWEVHPVYKSAVQQATVSEGESREHIVARAIHYPYIDIPKMERNARLIAAAPKMFNIILQALTPLSTEKPIDELMIELDAESEKLLEWIVNGGDQPES